MSLETVQTVEGEMRGGGEARTSLLVPPPVGRGPIHERLQAGGDKRLLCASTETARGSLSFACTRFCMQHQSRFRGERCAPSRSETRIRVTTKGAGTAGAEEVGQKARQGILLFSSLAQLSSGPIVMPAFSQTERPRSFIPFW